MDDTEHAAGHESHTTPIGNTARETTHDGMCHTCVPWARVVAISDAAASRTSSSRAMCPRPKKR